MTNAFAIVGMACCYPDARSPDDLWRNVLAQRRSFRRIPSERFSLDNYYSPDPDMPDHTYSTMAALIEGYEFDRVRYRVAGSTFRTADLTHWLALDVASQALGDAGFHEGEGLQHETTGVFVGNTLTGEFSRANTLRLRWPYIRRVVGAVLAQKGSPAEERQEFIKNLEALYKEPFPPVGEESLAGGLSNTIAGRICNYFDLKGGGFTVDGACASSLLAVISACSALAGGDVDVALAGGVDLSIDPFEIVGFAKTGALAAEKMRVYDARSAGFWPGEGSGFVVLMRYEDALAQNKRIYASIRGWGISSDGSGGITRPEVEGQLLALRRAYRRAGYGIDTVTYFEGHGTGTSVGDAVELKALSLARKESQLDSYTAFIGSIKANIGHTKAAAGIAGLIKAAMALHHQFLPPTTGCDEPHPELRSESPALSVLNEGQVWPGNRALRAGVSAMGFGGINTHLALEGAATKRRKSESVQERALISTAQDAEVFFLEGRTAEELQIQVERLLTFASKISWAEMPDLALELEKNLDRCVSRAAIVASTPDELEARLRTLLSWIVNGTSKRTDARAGLFLNMKAGAARIGFLFPGQGSPSNLGGGALRRRFDFVREIYESISLPSGGDGIDTSIAQPAVVTASLAGLQALDKLGVSASVGVGHSLGEITALMWAGAISAESLLRIAMSRGAAMSTLGSANGAMASIGAGNEEVESLLDYDEVVIAGLNSPNQTVVSGVSTAITRVVARARARGLSASRLPVSHAFHSPMVAEAIPVLKQHLAREEFLPPRRRVISTVTGAPLGQDEDLRLLLCRQITLPVRFSEALTTASEGLDLLIEIGPGHVLSGLAAEFIDVPVIALDAGGPSMRGFLSAIAAAYTLGLDVNHAALFEGRFTRPFSLDYRPSFFVNPCEMAPIFEDSIDQNPGAAEQDEGYQEIDFIEGLPAENATQALAILKRLVAERAELPLSSVKDDSRLLGDLHLNSITVSQLVASAARQLGLPPPIAPSEYSNATLAEAAKALEGMSKQSRATSVEVLLSPGIDSWIRAFAVEMVERPLHKRKSQTSHGKWQVIAPADYPLKEQFEKAFASFGAGGGVVLCLPRNPNERHLSLLLLGAHTALQSNDISHFVLVQHGSGATSFAKTLHKEAKGISTTVIDIPFNHPDALRWVLDEVKAASGFNEVYYSADGVRRHPTLRLLSLENRNGELPLNKEDVLLVTGGGKGIASECALSLARETRVRLALVGRSTPAADAELATNLNRFTSAGAEFRYYSADVCDANAVREVVERAQKELGPITSVLHGAGANVPQLLSFLNEASWLRNMGPKLQGARNVLAEIDPNRLKLLITFGSLIARTGMRGEADYAVANEWLGHLVEQWQAEHPHCRCLNIEWSVWSGVGMGERLGSIDALIQQGIAPIPADESIRIMKNLLRCKQPSTSVVVTGRFGDASLVKLAQPALPFLRFLEDTRVFYPGVELVVDADLSVDTDPYLDDHAYRGERLLPAVMGFEAMAQVSTALLQTDEIPIFENVELSRPVVVPRGSKLRIRLAALVRETGVVEVVLRSAETDFQADHFRAVCLFGARKADAHTEVAFGQKQAPDLDKLHRINIDPCKDLYGNILFHKGRFQRLQGYKKLGAKECLAEISPDGTTTWFGRYLPGQLLLGDPGARDAAIHSIQACIPHATVLPIGVEQIIINSTQRNVPMFLNARERKREGDTFTYDLEVIEADGFVCEQWRGLRLRMVSQPDLPESWAEA
ncbi:MAG TPA: type I polyketide synthase, partial [Blastocatellia bacterium]